MSSNCAIVLCLSLFLCVVVGSNVPLYQQVDYDSDAGYPSDIFTDYWIEWADDFVVPDGYVWNVSEIVMGGFFLYNMSGSPLLQSWNVCIYDAGVSPDDGFTIVPNNLVYSWQGIPSNGLFPPQLFPDVLFPDYVTLQAGTYWLSVQLKENTTLSNHIYGWYVSFRNDTLAGSILGQPATVRDQSGQVFGTPDWVPVIGTTGQDLQDLIFIIAGTATKLPTPTTGQFTTGQATTGRATTGRATTGQATTGRATTGRATTGQATTGVVTSTTTSTTKTTGSIISSASSLGAFVTMIGALMLL